MPARRSIRWSGGYTFAEDPGRTAPDARIIWHADFDPATLVATAVPASASDPDAIDADRLRPWLAVAVDPGGEHAVLSDGWRHIRIDIVRGSLTAGQSVILHYRLSGVASIQPKLLSLRQLIELARHGRFAHSFFPDDARAVRQLLALRVHDAISAGASQREIAAVLFGADAADADARSDSLRSRVRRLVREARRMAGGGWRVLMRGADRRDW